MQTIGVGPVRGLSHPSLARQHRLTGISHVRCRHDVRSCIAVQVTAHTAAAAEAPAATATASADESSINNALLQSSRAAVVKGLSGPVVKITAHYHVDFGDYLKVVGSSSEFGAWNAASAPLMTWGEGDLWSLVVPLSAGDHEFKVVVQKADGSLLWEGGDNRKVAVPEDAPVGSMLVADCAFNYADIMPAPELQPLTEDVLAVLEQQAEAERVEQLNATAAEQEKSNVSEAAAAVAKALATMDAEAEETGRRSSFSNSPSDSLEGTLSFDEGSDEDSLLSAATGATAGVSKALQAAEEEVLVEEDRAAAAAEVEMDLVLEAMSSQVLEAPFPDATPPTASNPVNAVHAKLAQDKAVAIGFIHFPRHDAPEAYEPQHSSRAAADKPGSTNSVVAAFMKSVAKKPDAIEALETDASVFTGDVVYKAEDTSETFVTDRPAVPEAVIELPTVPAHPEEPAPALEPVEAHPDSALAAAAAALAAAAEPLAETTQATPEVVETPPEVRTVAATPVSELTTAAVESPGVPGTPTPSPATPSPASDSGSASPKAWGPAPLTINTGSALGARGYSSSSNIRGRLTTTSPVTPSSSPKSSRSPSPGRGSSHVAAAAAAAAMDWMEDMRSNEVLAASREAEKAAKQKAARLAAAQRAAYAAAAESERLTQNLSNVRKGSMSGSSTPGGRLSAAAASGAGVMTMPAPPDVMSAMEAGQVFSMGSATIVSASSTAGLHPPAVAAPSSSSSSMPVAAALAADASMGGGSTASADSGAASEGFASGMQFLSAVVGCAAVGTVMWSEFVLRDTGCGLPPGPYGLLGAAEGLSYLAVLGFAGAGVAARGTSGGKKGLPGALVVPEVMAYGALAAGLVVLASQLQQYGYIPPPLPGGQCYPDAAVAMPGTEDLSAQLSAQLAALQAILSQLKTAAADGIDQLALQEQLAALQQQVDTFSAYVSTQASSIDASLQVGLVQLQDSLTSATTAVSSFVDMQLQQLDIPGKLAYVLDVLKRQEQALVVELPKQFAELQHLAATSIGIVQETALQASTAAHLPELLASLDKSMGVLHDVLELRIQQLDVVLTQLHDSCAAAASQLAAAALAAEQAGSAEAAAQLGSLQQMLTTTIASVQEQVWAGYQQLALADHLSDSLLHIRASAAAVAASTAAEAEKLQLEKQLADLESVAEASLAALSASAMDQLAKLELEQKFVEIEGQAAAAAESLQAGLVQQYNQQLPVLQQQLSQLQDNLADVAANAQQGLANQAEHAGPELKALLLQLQQSMEATVKVVGEVASSSADVASQQLQVASSNVEQVSGNMADYVSNSVVNAVDSTAVESVPTVLLPEPAAVQDAAVAISAAATEAAAPVGESAATLVASAAELAAPAQKAVAVMASVPAEMLVEPLVDELSAVDLTDASDAMKDIWANRPQ